MQRELRRRRFMRMRTIHLAMQGIRCRRTHCGTHPPPARWSPLHPSRPAGPMPGRQRSPPSHLCGQLVHWRHVVKHEVQILGHVAVGGLARGRGSAAPCARARYSRSPVLCVCAWGMGPPLPAASALLAPNPLHEQPCHTTDAAGQGGGRPPVKGSQPPPVMGMSARLGPGVVSVLAMMNCTICVVAVGRRVVGWGGGACGMGRWGEVHGYAGVTWWSCMQ